MEGFEFTINFNDPEYIRKCNERNAKIVEELYLNSDTVFFDEEGNEIARITKEEKRQL